MRFSGVCPQARDDTVERGVGVLEIFFRTVFRTLLLVRIGIGHPATPLSVFGVRSGADSTADPNNRARGEY